VPGELGLQLPVGQGDDPEALPRVALQGLPEALWHCRQQGETNTSDVKQDILIICSTGQNERGTFFFN